MRNRGKKESNYQYNNVSHAPEKYVSTLNRATQYPLKKKKTETMTHQEISGCYG